MTAALLHVLRAGPAVTVQDRGRHGTLAFGLSAGGAADPEALDEAAALLALPPGPARTLAGLEMAGQGGAFRAVRRRTEEVTFGWGRKQSGETSNKISGSACHCT